MASLDLLEEARTADGMTLAEVAREIPGRSAIQGDAGRRVLGVQHDSRRVLPGDLFVVRRGAQHDARAFVPAALERGAVALLAEEGLALELGERVPSVPVLRVADVKDGLAWAAAAVYGHPAFALEIIGVTGTNGKTTTTHLLRAAIDGSLGKELCGVVGTVGHSFAGRRIEAAHTTPEADELARILAVMKKRGATHAAMEVSSIALVLRRALAIRFRVAAFTNLTQDHLDFHGSMEAYAAAKTELFTTMAPGLGVVCVDGELGRSIAKTAKCDILRVRTSPPRSAGDADVFPESVETGPGGMRILARLPGRSVTMETRLVGAHNVENLLVTMGIVVALELDVDRAAAALATESGAPGRLERCDEPGDDVVVLVDYAHTPDALGRVLEAVRGVSRGRVVCVFGCGGDRDPTKRGPMGRAVAERADVAVVTSDNPRTEDPAKIAEPVEAAVLACGLPRLGAAEFAAGERGYKVELDRRTAIAFAIAHAQPGDVVLVAGKGHEDYQIIGTDKRPFDDRIEAQKALERRRAAKKA
jgi:UDP-N-acetylmuramoyl-L-alanyl-D-glutamate--2,6-diaminopimelate ligase